MTDPPALSPQDAERHLLGLERFGMRFGLERMRTLLAELGDPQRDLRCVHVVGSNGKSSTTRMTAAILRAHGQRAGAYTSPHLRSFTERVEIDGRPLAGPAFAAAVARVLPAAARVEAGRDDDDRVTQFEALTAAAVTALADAGVDVAVVEAGLGARYDATSVIDARVQVLTSVALEHTRWLGDTLEAIAGEKLAVVPEGGTLVLAPQAPVVDALARAQARGRGARLVEVDVDPEAPFPEVNAATARAAAAEVLGGLRPGVAEAALARLTLPGRLDVLDRDPLTIADGAHNPAAAVALLTALGDAASGRPLVGVVSVLGDKDAEEFLKVLLPHCARLVVTENRNPRAVPAPDLAAIASEFGGPPVEAIADPHTALARGRDLARDLGGCVVATGSLSLVADLLDPEGNRTVSSL